MKIFQWIKEAWKLLPLWFFINLFARIFIGSAVIDAYATTGYEGSVLFVQIVITLWMLSPIYYSIRNTYYQTMGTQTWRTILLNDFIKARYRLEKATKNRIKQKKLRIWVEQNPEIHLFNYWFLKHWRRREWMNIQVREGYVIPELNGGMEDDRN